MVAVELYDREDDYGYNSRTGEFVNMIEAGIIDPAEVLITCLKNAASVASMLLTTEALLVEKQPENGK